jgi:tetratricopeptide (TPR) repeat protein
MTSTCDSAASDGRSLIQTQLVPRDSTASMQTIPPHLTIRSPSSGSFDWFKEYIDYSESINGSPTVASSNLLMEMLLSFQKVLDNYEDERAYKSFTEGLRLDHYCNECRILHTITKLQYCLEGADVKMSMKKIENWAQATVEKAIQLYDGRDDVFMARVGEAVGELYLVLGKVWEAKLYLERAILEMKRIDSPLLFRKEATIALAECYSDLGNIQQADDLLKVLFKTEYPKIVAASYLTLESYCRKGWIRLLKICYSKAEDNLVQDANDIVGYKWEEDGVELEIRVTAAKLIRKFNPGIIEEMGGCDNSFEYSGAAKDEVDDELDKGM